MTQSVEHFSSFDVAGSPSAFPIVFIHGAAWSRNMWIPQMEALSSEFRVIAIDLPGHGTLREKPFRLASAIQSISECLAHETQQSALLVGLSLGGYVAMASAQKYPQQVAGLVLSGCSIDYRGAIGILSQLDSFIVTTLFPERWLTRMQEKSLRATFPEKLIESQLKAGFSWKAMPHIYRELASHNFHPVLQSFTSPVLIMNGENDRQNRKRESALLTSTHNGQLQIIKHAGHLCNLDQPEIFSDLIRTFAKSLSANATQ